MLHAAIQIIFTNFNFQFDSLENASNSMDRIALPKTKGCLIEYTYIEVIHAAIQIILAFFGIVLSWLLAKYYYSAVDVKRKKAKKSNNMYSIEYSPQVRYDVYNLKFGYNEFLQSLQYNKISKFKITAQ